MASFMAKRFGSLMLNRTKNSRFISTGTSPTDKAAIGTVNTVHADAHTRQSKGQWAPVAVVIGFVGIAGCMALHTAIQQLGRSPTVKVSKKNRETMSEVFDPDTFVGSASRFVDKSFFRKISKIQDPKNSPFPSLPDPFTRSREIESLKSIGVFR